MCAEASDREALTGLVERVTYHSTESGFCVLRLKARGHRDLVTLIGHAATISAGEWVTATGGWVNDRQHGLQFRADFLKASAPTSVDGIRRYLASGMIRGIGPVYGQKLVDAFGADVFDVIEQTPARLREVDGIGPKRAQRIVDAWAEQKVVREIMIFLHSHGVGTARAVRIYKTYGAEAVQVMSDNPYRLARDIRGIGFRTADAIAERVGIARTAEVRVRAGVSHALTEAVGDGHCGLPRAELVPLTERLLEVPRELITDALAQELGEGTIVADTVGEAECLFLAGLHAAERGIALRLTALRRQPTPWPAIDVDAAIAWVERRTGMHLAEAQRDALHTAVSEPVTVITGGPGVGKTTLVNAILRVLAAKGTRIKLCAPTGRAAKRLTETTGMAATTIHRLLGADPATGGFQRTAESPLELDLLVVDEASMIDVPLMHALLRVVPDGAGLLVVGDVDQLPSVGPGQVLADMIAAGTVPVVRLTEVFRQAAQSRIVTAAHRVNAGKVPDLRPPSDTSDFYFVGAEDPETAVARVLEIVARRIPRRFGYDPVRDVQVLCPMNRGGLGARALNAELQQTLNPDAAPRVARFGSVHAPGDKVMQIENDYDKEVYNGDVGFVAAVDPDQGEVTARFDGEPVVYGLGELDALVTAYAATIHKSQGSEYPVVVIPMTTQHYPMLQRNLLYTGLTRGKRLVVLVGQAKAVAMAARGGAAGRRWSKLREHLAAAGDAPAVATS